MKTTKIKALAAICLMAFAMTATAQLRFGVKGGVGIIDHKIKSDILNTKNRLGFSIGPTLELMFPAGGWGIDLSVLYGYKKYSVEESEEYAGMIDLTNYKYVAIPLNLKKRFDLGIVGLYALAGPYAAVKIDGGDLKVKYETSVESFKSKNFEFGINAGFGISLFKHLDAGLTYKCRLTDNFETNRPEFEDLKDKKYQSWEAGLTYFF